MSIVVTNGVTEYSIDQTKDMVDYSLFSYNMNLRSWLEAQSGSISPADNIRSRLAGTARSAKRTSCKATRAREASGCEATSLRSRQARAAQSVAPQPVQAVDCGRIVSSSAKCTHPHAQAASGNTL
jgi:hypothetical protein